MEPSSQLKTQDHKTSNFQEEKGIEIFKSFNVPKLEKIISSSKNLFTDLLKYSGQIWNNNKEIPAVQSLPESSSSGNNHEDSQFIILQRMATMNNVKTFHSKPRKIRMFKSFAPSICRSPYLTIEEDVQSQVRSIKGESFMNEGTSMLSSNCYLSSTLNLNTSALRKSTGCKDNSILPGLNSLILEDDEKSDEKADFFPAETKKIKKNELNNSGTFNGIPEVFEVGTCSDVKSQNSQKIEFALETEPDKPQGVINLEEAIKLSETKSPEDSLEYLCRVIPRAILYQLPVLTFEEFVNSLMNDELKKSKKKLWTGSCSRKLINLCCCYILSSDDYLICEKIIDFKLTSFSFQNSLHLILLLSCYKSANKSDKWPVKEEDWCEMGFNSENIGKELENNGTITLLHIFFLSSYFPKFFSEMLRVRSYYSFDLYEIISSVSEIVFDNLRKNKVNKLIKSNGRALEVVFFYFAGVMLYWFKKLIKCKNYFKIYDSTARKASREMDSLLKEAWRVYLESNVN